MNILKISALTIVFAAAGTFARAEDKAAPGGPGPNFAEHKAKVLAEIDEHIAKMTEHKSCVSAAADHAAMKACHEKMEAYHKSERAEHMEKREERKGKMGAPNTTNPAK